MSIARGRRTFKWYATLACGQASPPSWPGLSRPSTPLSAGLRAWMPGTSPGMTKNVHVLETTPAASAHALPGLAAAEHAAEGAALHAHCIRTLHRDRRVVVAAGVGIVNAAAPLRAVGLHVDQDALVGLCGVAAEIDAALLDADIALVLFGGPNADRCVGNRDRRGDGSRSGGRCNRDRGGGGSGSRGGNGRSLRRGVVTGGWSSGSRRARCRDSGRCRCGRLHGGLLHGLLLHRSRGGLRRRGRSRRGVDVIILRAQALEVDVVQL